MYFIIIFYFIICWRLPEGILQRLQFACQGVPADPKMPWQYLAHTCCAELCHSKVRLFLIPPLPVRPTMERAATG